MYLVEDLLAQHGDRLSLKVIAGAKGLSKQIKVPEAQRPGLSLSGYLKNYAHKRILVFGKVETNFIRDLDPKVRTKRLESLFSEDTPAVVIARGYTPPKELSQLCEEKNIPLLRTQLSTMNILSKLIVLLHNEFAPTMSCHGTLVEVFGVGVLIQGESAVGKSESALGLIERGHRLISDDIVKVKKRDDNYLEGFGAELTKHHLEIRGIGIINVANLYGVVCVRDHKSIDIVVQLELWDDHHFYDRVGIDDKTTTILDVELPFHVLPVKPGRDVVLLLETIARNHRLKKMGYNSAKEFQAKLTETISRQARGAKK